MSSPLKEVATGPQTQKTATKPKVHLPGDNKIQSVFNDEIAKIINECNAPLYRRDTQVVIANDPNKRLRQMTPKMFISWAERYLVTYRTRTDSMGDPYDVYRSMTADTSGNVLESVDFVEKIPEITRTRPLPMPHIKDDGTLKLSEPGYDASNGTYTFPSDIPRTKPKKSSNKDLPSSEGYYDDSLSLEDAVTYLYSIYKEFPFADWSDPYTPDYFEHNTQICTSRSFACQIAANVSLFASSLLPPMSSRMGFLYNANSQRSGKTLLAKMAITPIYGRFKALPWQPNDENMTKLLDSEVLAASSYICFDNIRGILASQPLEGFMTSPHWAGRLLGKSETFEAENNSQIFITGNNLNIGTDVFQRFLTIDLNIQEANPQDREILNVIDDYWLSVTKNRHKIISCLWAMVRYWNLAGRPKATGKPFQGFEIWGQIIGGIVEHAGLGNILERPVLTNAGDTESSDMLELIEKLSRKDETTHYTFQQVIDCMYDNELVAWKLKGRSEWNMETQREHLKLEHSAVSGVGIMLRNYANGNRGKIYTIAEVSATDASPTNRYYKFSIEGKGRHKKYTVEDVTSQKNATT